MERYCLRALMAFLLFYSVNCYSQTNLNIPDVERVWADQEIGKERLGRNYNHAMGFNFTPLVDGQILSLGGNFDGYYQVKLFNRETGELLAETYVASSNEWAYQDISPITVNAGTQYTVAAYILGSGGSIMVNRSVPFPYVTGNIRFDGRTHKRIRNDPEVRPTNNSLVNVVRGRADVLFLAEEEVEPPVDYDYHLGLDSSFNVTRNGAVGDDVVWHVEKDGAQVLRRNAAGELSFKYFSNTVGSDLRIWLIGYIDGSYQQISNAVEYTPGTTDLFELELGVSFDLTRTGVIGDQLTWVIEKDNQIVLERNAENELMYTYFQNDIGSQFRVWLKQFINGEYKIVSNTIEYEVGLTNFELSIDQLFNLGRSGQLGDQVQWVVEKDGGIVLQRNAENELDYTYFSNTPGSSFRVWLTMFINGQYEIVSNIVTYDVPEQYEYDLTVDSSYLLTRSGLIGDSLTWVIIKDGTQVLGRNASNELTYRYFSNTSGSDFTVYLESFSNGYYQPVSNTVTYTVP